MTTAENMGIPDIHIGETTVWLCGCGEFRIGFHDRNEARVDAAAHAAARHVEIEGNMTLEVEEVDE